MPCMTQTSTNPLRAPHALPISIHRSPRHHHSAPRPISHPRSHPAPPSPPEPNQGQPSIDVNAQDPGSPSSRFPPGPRAPPPHTGHHPRPRPPPSNPPRQGPGPPPLGWYRLHKDWTKLTVKALRDLTTPGSGRQETIVDLVLWRARKHTQGQHVWIPPIEWGPALTHDTGINVTRQATVRLRRAQAETDHPADPNHPGQWEQATAPTRDTALRAAGLRTPDDDPPPPTYRQ